MTPYDAEAEARRLSFDPEVAAEIAAALQAAHDAGAREMRERAAQTLLSRAMDAVRALPLWANTACDRAVSA